MPAMELRGPRLTLRLPAPQDAPALLHAGGDEEVTRWFSWGPYRRVEEPLAWIAQQEARRKDGLQLDCVVEHRQQGVIGVTGLAELSVRDRRAMVGTWFGRDWWGTGVNRESKALVAHLAFAVCGMERISAYANPENGRSVTALERVGFVREGTLRRWHRHGERQLDVHLYGMLRDEWEAGPLRGVSVTAVGTPPEAWVVG
jgi:ribosomal-protein-alanine N-acetyltransferase